MLFSIKCGNVEGVSPDQRRLVYLVTSTEAIYSAGLPCVMSDGNAATMITKFGDDPEDLDTEVDWELMQERIWRNSRRIPTGCGAEWLSSSCTKRYRWS
jgi:hypothetical protein